MQSVQTLLASAVLLTPGLALLPPPPLPAEELPQVQKAREFMEKGEHDAALAAAEEGLEFEPENLALLELASLAAEAMDLHDLALWHMSSALGLAEKNADLVGRLEPRMAELDLVGADSGLLKQFSNYSREVFDLGKTCLGKRYYVNAADLFMQCRGTRMESRAEEALDEMFENTKARTALAESGMQLPAESISKSRARWVAAQDEKHNSWKTAYDRESRNYKVMTDAGYQVLQNVMEAMEIMNRFYREVFDHKKKTDRCLIKIYKSRADFDEGEREAYSGKGPPPTVRGFYSPTTNYVATYLDSSHGRSSLDVWSTLFHEASHQFTHAATEGLIPGWLNEGTASYFEGARLFPNGSVQTNDIPEGRLRGAYQAIAIGEPELGTVINYYRPGSYPGEYYPVGWSLAYFFHNYEDDKCERVYVPFYRDYLKSYKKAKKHTPIERFIEYFVDKPKQPGIETFEQFEERWKEWVLELYGMYFGPSEKAADWVERARKQMKFKKYHAALESYRYALRKRPKDPVALYERALVYALEKEKDPAFLSFRKALEVVRNLPQDAVVEGLGMTPPKLIDDILQRMSRLDRQIASATRKAFVDFATAAAEAAEAYYEGGFPRMAISMLDDASILLGGDRRLKELRREIVDGSGINVFRWQRLTVAPGLPDWYSVAGWQAEGDKILARSGGGLDYGFYRHSLPPSYRLQVTVTPKQRQGQSVFGLVYGYSTAGLEGLCVGSSAVIKTDDEDTKALAPLKPSERNQVVLEVAVEPTRVEFFVNGQSVGSEEFEEGELDARIGLFVQNGAAEFSRLRAAF